MRPWRLKILAVCSEHPKRDQNPKFTRETTSIPVCFMYESPPGQITNDFVIKSDFSDRVFKLKLVMLKVWAGSLS